MSRKCRINPAGCSQSPAFSSLWIKEAAAAAVALVEWALGVKGGPGWGEDCWSLGAAEVSAVGLASGRAVRERFGLGTRYALREVLNWALGW